MIMKKQLLLSVNLSLLLGILLYLVFHPSSGYNIPLVEIISLFQVDRFSLFLWFISIEPTDQMSKISYYDNVCKMKLVLSQYNYRPGYRFTRNLLPWLVYWEETYFYYSLTEKIFQCSHEYMTKNCPLPSFNQNTLKGFEKIKAFRKYLLIV